MVCLPSPSHRVTLGRLWNMDCPIRTSTEEPGTRFIYNIAAGNTPQVKRLSAPITATRQDLAQLRKPQRAWTVYVELLFYLTLFTKGGRSYLYSLSFYTYGLLNY